VLPVFRTLRRRGHRLGLISNWDQRLRPVLGGLDLDVWLDPIVISCEVGAEKPDPAIFRIALDAARAQPSEALMVGDAPAADIEGARGVDMPGVLLNPGGWYRGPLPSIASLEELPEWIDKGFTDATV
jgi:putative hydrolase of the HAD superfamily